MMKRITLLIVFALALGGSVYAQTGTQSTDKLEPQRVDRLETRVSSLEQKIRKAGDQGLAVFLFGAVCALWAQNTGRNAWLWFFLGMFFSVITVLVLLYKNSGDIDRRRAAAQRA